MVPSRYVEPAADDYWDIDDQPQALLSARDPDLSSFSAPPFENDNNDVGGQFHSPGLPCHQFVQPSSSSSTSIYQHSHQQQIFQPFTYNPRHYRRSSDDLELCNHSNLSPSSPTPDNNTPTAVYYDSDPETINHTTNTIFYDINDTIENPLNSTIENMPTPTSTLSQSTDTPSPIPKLNYFVHDGFRYDGDVYELRHPDERTTQSRPERALAHKPCFLNNRQAFTRVYSEATYHTRPASLRFSKLSRLSHNNSCNTNGLNNTLNDMNAHTPTADEMSFLSEYLEQDETENKNTTTATSGGDDDDDDPITTYKRLSAEYSSSNSTKRPFSKSPSKTKTPTRKCTSPKIQKGNVGNYLPKPLLDIDQIEEQCSPSPSSSPSSNDRNLKATPHPKAIERLHYDKAAMMNYAAKARSSAGRRAVVKSPTSAGTTTIANGNDEGNDGRCGEHGTDSDDKSEKLTMMTVNNNNSSSSTGSVGLNVTGKASLWSAVSSSGTVLKTGDPKLDAELKLSSDKGDIMQRRMYAAAATAGTATGGGNGNEMTMMSTKGRDENIMGRSNEMKTKAHSTGGVEGGKKMKNGREKGLKSTIGALAGGAKRRAAKKAGLGASRKLETKAIQDLPPGSKRRWRDFMFGKWKF